MDSARAPGLDVASGMTTYANSASGRIVGTIRATPEDFQVEEILALGSVSLERSEEFPVPVYIVRKKGEDTPHVALDLARALKSNVNFAGMKDSRAVTTQYASARSRRAADPPEVRGARFEATRVGYLRTPLTRAMMSGNRFTVRVTTKEDVGSAVEEVYGMCADRRIPNFFGHQRFGLKGMVNHRVGRSILGRDFKGAIETFLAEPRRGESHAGAYARELAAAGRYSEASVAFSPGQDLERRIARHLAERPGDYLGALRRIPMTPRRLFVQAYQSFIFNRTLSAALESGLDMSKARDGDNWARISEDGLGAGKVHGVKEVFEPEDALALVQLVGYAFRDYGSRFDALLLSVLKDEGVSPSQFYVKEAEELSNEGGFRHAPLLAKDCAFSTTGAKPTLTFTLGKGEYATTLMREVLKPEDPLAAGF